MVNFFIYWSLNDHLKDAMDYAKLNHNTEVKESCKVTNFCP